MDQGLSPGSDPHAPGIRRRTAMAGAAASLLAAPAVLAQPQRLPRVAIVSTILTLERLTIALTSPEPVAEASGTRDWGFFFQELRRLGYLPGQTVAIELRSVALLFDPADRAAVLREVVDSAPDVIVADRSDWVLQVKAATSTIPIVANVAEPVESGITPSLARPDANVTGFGTNAGMEMEAKRIQMLVEMAPTAGRVAYAGPRRTVELLPGAADGFPAVREDLARAGIEMVVILVDPPASAEPADVRAWERGLVASVLEAGCGGLVYRSGPFGAAVDHALLASLLIEARLPTHADNLTFFFAGGLMCYTNNRVEQYAGLAGYVARILEGATPGELPFQLPRLWDLFINKRTADALGLTIPQSLLFLAPEIIE